jgi:ADP-heptose:LPS heptosyltransferase/predicted aldo/keto reductase-like oxidoreductase
MPGRIVACLFNARGDYLLNLPALRALAAAFPQQLVLVVRRGAYQTFLRDVDARGVVEADVRYAEGAYQFDVNVVAAAVRRYGDAECFVSLNPWASGQLDELCARLDPPRSAGLGTGPWTDPVPLDFSCHSSELALRVVQRLIAAPRAAAHSPAYPPEAQRFARELRDELAGGPLLAVHRDTKSGKQWLDDRWAELLATWSARHPDGLVVDVGLAPASAEIAARWGERVLRDLRLPLEYALAVTGVADVFAGIDSCFLHAADLARVPSVGLFFTTDPNEFGFRWTEHRHLVAPEPSALAVGPVAEALEYLTARPRARLAVQESSAATRSAPGARANAGLAARWHRGLNLGTIGLGTSAYSFACDREATAVIKAMVALGANVIDLAANYGGGDSCAVVGTALRAMVASGDITREELFLCTKAGFTEHLAGTAAARSRGWNLGGHCLDTDYLAWEFERQRRWLGVEALDAFLVHNPEEQLPARGKQALLEQLEKAFELLEGLVAAGSLRHYGVSTVDALRVPRSDPRHIDLAEIEAAALRAGGVNHHFSVVEIPVSLAHLEAFDLPAHTLPGSDPRAVPALEWAAGKGLLVLASIPLNHGHQLDKLAQPARQYTTIEDDAAALLEVVRSLPGVSCALVGITNPRHVASVALLAGRAPMDLKAPAVP